MKKKLSLLLLTICILFCSFGFVSCADNYDFTITDARYYYSQEDKVYVKDIKCSFTAPEDMILKTIEYLPCGDDNYDLNYFFFGGGIGFSNWKYGLVPWTSIPGWIKIDGIDSLALDDRTIIKKGSQIEVAFPIFSSYTGYDFQVDNWDFVLNATKPDKTQLLNFCVDNERDIWTYRIARVNMKKLLKEDVSLLTQWKEFRNER